MTACPHEDAVEGGGERICRTCGLVLESSMMVVDEYAFRQYPLRKSSYYSWQRAIKEVLHNLGISRDVSESFGRPFEDASMSEARKRIAGGVRLQVLAAYCVLIRFRYCISTEEARKAGGATHKEWRRAAEILGKQEEPDETTLDVYRKARSLGLPDAIPQATLDAMQEPRLECCDPSKVLVASAGETLGDDLAASLFGMQPMEIASARAKYKLQAFAADLTGVGLCLRFCVERCKDDRRKMSAEKSVMQPWWYGGTPQMATQTDDELLQMHLSACTNCAFRAQELGLSFLLRSQTQR
jgi:hypothetical protein